MATPTTMWNDGDVSRNPENTTRMAINANLDIKKVTHTPEEAFELIQTYDSSLTPVGFVTLPNGDVAVFSQADNADYTNEIGIIIDDTYSPKLRDNVDEGVNFNFSKIHLIKGVSKQNVNGDVIIYWVDGYNFDKYLNLTNPQIELDSTLRIASANSLELLSLSRVTRSNNFTLNSVDAGGSLYSGVYYIAIQQLDRDKNTTQVGLLSNPISIVNKSAQNFTPSYDGCVANTLTNNAINFTVPAADLNPDYPYIRVLVISKINQSFI